MTNVLVFYSSHSCLVFKASLNMQTGVEISNFKRNVPLKFIVQENSIFSKFGNENAGDFEML